jgi:hypothetical protein
VRRLTGVLSQSLQSNPDLRHRLGRVTSFASIETILISSVHPKTTTYNLMKRAKSVEDTTQVTQQWRVAASSSGGAGIARQEGIVTVVAMQQTPATGVDGRSWRIVESKIALRGQPKSIPILGLRVDLPRQYCNSAESGVPLSVTHSHAHAKCIAAHKVF